jgi:arginyl-tRNA synthetase
MAATNVDAELADLLANSRGERTLPAYSGAFPSINPVDIFRCVITEELAAITKLDASLIYPALEWTSTLEKGDLVLAVPRLRVKGSPTEIASSWAAAVSRSIQFASITLLSTITVLDEPTD